MSLTRLLFYSTNQVQALEGSLQQELKSILIASQTHNPELHVSGALLFDYSYFAQVLEGPAQAITQIFCKVAQDPRHTNIVIADVSPIDQRMFESWNMAFVGGAGSEVHINRYGTTDGFDPSSMSVESLLGFMQVMIKRSNEAHARTKKAS